MRDRRGRGEGGQVLVFCWACFNYAVPFPA